MIKKSTSLSMIEASEFIKSKEDNKEIAGFIKKFSKINPEKAKKIREEISSLDLMKIKQEDISKIIDILPENAIELNKIFSDLSLDENETNKVLEVVKKNK